MLLRREALFETCRRWFRYAAAGLVVVLLLAATTVTDPTRSDAAAQEADTEGPAEPRGLGVVPSTGDTAQQIEFDGEGESLEAATDVVAASIDADAAKHGANGLLIDATNSQGIVRWGSAALTPGATYATASFWVRVDDAAPGESIDLLTVANAENNRNFDFFVTSGTGRFKWDIFSEAQREAGQVERNRWYFVEVQVSFAGSTHWASVSIDGEDWGTITSPGVDSTVGFVSVGSAAAKTHRQAYDDISVQLGQSPQLWSGTGLDTATLNWLPVVDQRSGVREYEIWRNDVWYGWVPGNETTFIDIEPEPGARYRIRAIDEALNAGDWSRTVLLPRTPDFEGSSPRVEPVGPSIEPAPTPTPGQLDQLAAQDKAAAQYWLPLLRDAVLGLIAWW